MVAVTKFTVAEIMQTARRGSIQGNGCGVGRSFNQAVFQLSSVTRNKLSQFQVKFWKVLWLFMTICASIWQLMIAYASGVIKLLQCELVYIHVVRVIGRKRSWTRLQGWRFLWCPIWREKNLWVWCFVGQWKEVHAAHWLYLSPHYLWKRDPREAAAL